MLFLNRADAGRHLAQRLRHLRGTDVAVLGLPRGGVPVAFEVAEELRAPLDVIMVRKLGVPFQPEYGFGAIGEGGVRVIDEHVTRLVIVPGATHLFEEPGALEQVADLARDWFSGHFAKLSSAAAAPPA